MLLQALSMSFLEALVAHEVVVEFRYPNRLLLFSVFVGANLTFLKMTALWAAACVNVLCNRISHFVEFELEIVEVCQLVEGEVAVTED